MYAADSIDIVMAACGQKCRSETNLTKLSDKSILHRLTHRKHRAADSVIPSHSSFTLPSSPRSNGIGGRHIRMSCIGPSHSAWRSCSRSVGFNVIALILATAGRATDAVRCALLAVVRRVQDPSAEIATHRGPSIEVVAISGRHGVGRHAVAVPDANVSSRVAIACVGSSSTFTFRNRKAARDPTIGSVGAGSPAD